MRRFWVDCYGSAEEGCRPQTRCLKAPSVGDDAYLRVLPFIWPNKMQYSRAFRTTSNTK